MRRMTSLALLLPFAALAACGSETQPPSTDEPRIKVRSSEQEELHKFDAFNLAIALKRAIQDAGFTCRRVTDAGFVGAYQNLDMWAAHCEYDRGEPRDWAIFAGPDGSAQVRDCRDIPGTGLPTCDIKSRPKGSFTELK